MTLKCSFSVYEYTVKMFHIVSWNFIYYFLASSLQTPGTLCRHAVGCILSEGENQVDEELLKRCKASGFNVFSFPEITHVVTTSVPHRAFFSTILRVKRVYPQLEQYIKVCGSFLALFPPWKKNLISFAYNFEWKAAQLKLPKSFLHSNDKCYQLNYGV